MSSSGTPAPTAAAADTNNTVVIQHAEDEDDDEEQQLAALMKRLGLPTEFGAAKRHKRQQPAAAAATPSTPTATPTPAPTTSTAPNTNTTTTTATDTPPQPPAAADATAQAQPQQRKRQQQQQRGSKWKQQQRQLDAGQRWQRRAHKDDVYDNPSYVGRAVVATDGQSAAEEGESKQPAVQVVWEEEEKSDEQWQQWQQEAGELASVIEAAQQQQYEHDAVSLYPHGYGRFAELSNDDNAEEDEDDTAMEEGIDAENGEQQRNNQLDVDEDWEEEVLDDYGLIDSEVLEGEDHTHAPIDAERRLRGLPPAQGRRVRLGEDGKEVVPVSEQVAELTEVQSHPTVSDGAEVKEQPQQKPEQQQEAETRDEEDERPDELPVVVSRSPLLPPAAEPEPLTSPPPLSPPASESLSMPPPVASTITIATTTTTKPLSPPLYPLSLLPTRFHVMDVLTAKYSEDRDDEEYVRAHAGEVIEGEDRTALPPPVSSSIRVRGVKKPNNKRVVFGDDGQMVVVGAGQADEQKDSSKEEQEPGQEEKKESATEEKAEEEDHKMQIEQQQEVPTTTSLTNTPSDPNLTDDVDPKYYAQRYRLFSRYDDGIRLDAVGWYSVTPEAIARHQAERIAASFNRPFTVIDAFCGLGGNTIAFALQPICERVFAIELDPHRLSLARHNAAVYGVSDKCEWIEGDWLQIQSQLHSPTTQPQHTPLRSDMQHATVLFLAPPWGGTQYGERESYKLADVALEGGGARLIEDGMRLGGVEGRVAVSLPRNVDVDEVVGVGGGGRVEVEYNRCNWKVKTVTAYYGALVKGSHSNSNSSTSNVSASDEAQPITPSIHSTLPSPPPSFATVVVENAGFLGYFASFLCFTGLSAHTRTPGQDNSLLVFASCSRRTQSLLTKDAWWWHQQHLVVDIVDPLISLYEWTCVSSDNDTLALMVDGFPVRQQAIMRRLLGSEVYEREVAARLSEVRTVMFDRERGMAAVGVDEDSEYEMDDAPAPEQDEPVDVYSQLTPAFFDRLAVEHELVGRTEDAVDAPHCQWLLGCWDALLLPKCAQWVRRATINIHLVHGLREPYQMLCLLRTLQCISGVAQLTVDFKEPDPFAAQDAHFHPSPTLPELMTALPKLASLHLSRLPLRHIVHEALRSSGLLHLRLDHCPLYGYGTRQGTFKPLEPDSAEPGGVCFSYPPLWPDAVRLSRQNRDDELTAGRKLWLRVKLWTAMWEHVRQQQSTVRVQERNELKLGAELTKLADELPSRELSNDTRDEDDWMDGAPEESQTRLGLIVLHLVHNLAMHCVAKAQRYRELLAG